MTTPNMSCPSGGDFYACTEGSRFVGCCGRNPCELGCAAGDLQPTSFEADQHGEIPDQSCSAGLFYTCAFTDPPFWGCCATSPCGDGCPSDQLSGAFISSNPGTAEPFLRLNETYNDGSSSDDSSNTGAIAGGVVGGIVGVAIIILGILWYLRRRRRAATKPDEPTEQIQELPAQEGTVLKNVAPSYDNSPGIGSWQSSPAQTQYSPRAPSYWSELPAKHVSYELPGSGIQTELEGSQTPEQLKPPQESRNE
ncbi:hypothetical protein M409DRAFT_16886 [Zasmidium cellare ATCC 36951]|uniref:Uncharacterized protein n=1 Tax=Zasmidium cellare ATCC 36951 TaxID=1080233 RepID=A0A6A6D1J8_ZASCE|nr:uncharacterized protein M409DRAFT_16886 [Zasmidium cellare ATCC 36951]KAF2172933.1 hypothetical protein M409DRAFT_16886 [Zasmidium cellare ATCC 36951]